LYSDYEPELLLYHPVEAGKIEIFHEAEKIFHEAHFSVANIFSIRMLSRWRARVKGISKY